LRTRSAKTIEITPAQLLGGPTAALQGSDLDTIQQLALSHRPRLLGKGGMGAVYEAEHLENGRRVALKVLAHSLDSPTARQRFLREGRLAASIINPNSVYIFGTEEIDDTPVITMEYVSGGTLTERVNRQGPMPIGEAVETSFKLWPDSKRQQARAYYIAM